MKALAILIATEVEYQRWIHYDKPAYLAALGTDQACRRYFWKTWDQFSFPNLDFNHDWNSE